MKKFLVTLLVGFALGGACYANNGKTPLNFVYIHGSDQGTAEEFEIWINRMHPNMKKNLEANEFVQAHFLNDAYIMPEKDMLYWADKTEQAKSVVEIGLKISKLVSSCVAQLTRSTLAHLLHDAIWLQKYVNMKPILNELNAKVIENSNQGEKSVLIGYSAGTFITYQYLLNKSRMFDLAEFFQKQQTFLEVTQQDIDALKLTNPKPTCIDAVVDSGIAFMGADGNLIANPHKEKLYNSFKKLNSQTELSCAPDNSIAGIINFGSPIVIFYSSNDDENSQLFYFSSKLYKHIIENKEFVLTVNYKTDPLGVPTENFSISDLAKFEDFSNTKLNGGFVYDTSVKGGIIFMSSHLKYWDQTNHFTKAVAKSYEKGYKYFYELEDVKK